MLLCVYVYLNSLSRGLMLYKLRLNLGERLPELFYVLIVFICVNKLGFEAFLTFDLIDGDELKCKDLFNLNLLD